MKFAINKKFLALLPLFFLWGCGPKVHFIQVGEDDYPGKPKDYEVLIYWGDNKPEKEYRVIGMVFIETDSPILFSPQISDSKVVNALKKEAKKHGADAIMDFTITSGYENLPDPDFVIDIRKTKRAEAKAVVFVEQENF
jgi:hypothetical protein